MREYTRLSDHDFESLIRDLLSAELKIRLESFARGRDQGIDLRYLGRRPQFGAFATLTAPDFIVQCKHYAKTGFSGLKSKLRNEELPKLQRLRPARLLLATSVDLTPANKADLKQTLTPFIVTEADIFGVSDIEAMLNRHAHVERTHYKLWLTSTTVLDRVLNSDIYHQTEHVLKNLKRNAIRYVQNNSYTRSIDILNKAHVCVIAGPAGIGKTTLAQMLLLYYIANDFQPVVVSEDATEANALWNPDPSVRQIFYYDDFLGQGATTDKLNKNEDDRLHYLLSSVSQTQNKRLLLTTREYILEQAKQEYEKLLRMDLDLMKHTIKLEDYTRLERAKILYNHLYFSALPPAVKSSIAKGRHYINIISHQNYNPRLIDSVAERALLTKVDATAFPRYFMEVLNDPETLWQSTYDHAISDEARLLLEVLASLPTTTTLDALRTAFDSAAGPAARRFLYAMKEVDGDFLRTVQYKSLTVVSFGNPSVRDFVLKRVVSTPANAAMLIEKAAFFDQVLLLDAQTRESPHSRTRLSRESVANSLIRTIRSGGCVVRSGHRDKVPFYELVVQSKAARLTAVIGTMAPSMVDARWLALELEPLRESWKEGSFGNQADIISLIESVASTSETMALELIGATTEGLRAREMEDIGDAEFARDFIACFNDNIDVSSKLDIINKFQGVMDDEFDAMLSSNDTDDIKTWLDNVTSIADDFGYSIPARLSEAVQTHIAELEEGYDQEPDYDDYGGGGTYSSSSSSASDDAPIHDLFDTLENE